MTTGELRATDPAEGSAAGGHASLRPLGVVAVGLVALLFAGCGSSDRDTARSPTGSLGTLRTQLEASTASRASDFPAVRGRSLQAVADAIGATGTQVGLAGSVFTPGENRLAFGVSDPRTGSVYAKTAVYVADRARGRARGPFPATADLLITEPAFRSQAAASENDNFAAVYAARVPFSSPGKKLVLVVTKRARRPLVVASTQITVIPVGRDRIPRPGERPPPISTDTVASARGNLKAIDTRVPADDMHDVDFADVIGKRPIALLFATPALCESRVCGPVVDIALQLKARYGDRVQFIHQEVYVDNQPLKGLRSPLRAFHLPTEPWLFVFDKHGRLTTRLEGSFGIDTFERALESGL